MGSCTVLDSLTELDEKTMFLYSLPKPSEYLGYELKSLQSLDLVIMGEWKMAKTHPWSRVACGGSHVLSCQLGVRFKVVMSACLSIYLAPLQKLQSVNLCRTFLHLTATTTLLLNLPYPRHPSQPSSSSTSPFVPFQSFQRQHISQSWWTPVLRRLRRRHVRLSSLLRRQPPRLRGVSYVFISSESPKAFFTRGTFRGNEFVR